jgi:ABC-2 type transport system permease protein
MPFALRLFRLHIPYAVLWAFLVRDLRNELSYRLSFVLQIIGIFPAVLMFFFLSRLVGTTISGPLGPYGGHYFPFVLIGIALQNYLTVSLSRFSGSLRESQLSGTLEVIMAAPVSLPVFLTGSTLYSFVFNALRVFIYLGAGALLFHVDIHWMRLPAAVGILILTMAAFSSLGIFSAAFIMLFKRGDPVNWAFSVVSWLLGGVYYPVSILPEWLQKGADLIPMTHALEALRIVLLTNGSIGSVGSSLAALGLWAVMGLPISLYAFRYALKQAKVQGTLGHY